MITRRAGGPAGAGAASGTGAAVSAALAAGVASPAEGAGTEAVAGGGAACTAGPAEAAASPGADVGAAVLGAAAAGAVATMGRSAGGTATGRSTEAAAGATATTGGRAITGPTGGLLAMAGTGGFATIFACWRGRGTIRRGAGACAAAGAWGTTGALGAAAATTRGGVELADGATTAGRCGGGTAFTAASACLRSRIAFSASPGLDTLDRSNFGLLSAACRPAPPLRPPFLKYSRTLSAWSASIELEWVLPDTPIASSASRIGLLFTSSSRARSLIRTLLIRPFSLPCALSCSYRPHRGLTLHYRYYPRNRRLRVPGKAVPRG